jgi:hypothetical protein
LRKVDSIDRENDIFSEISLLLNKLSDIEHAYSANIYVQKELVEDYTNNLIDAANKEFENELHIITEEAKGKINKLEHLKLHRIHEIEDIAAKSRSDNLNFANSIKEKIQNELDHCKFGILEWRDSMWEKYSHVDNYQIPELIRIGTLVFNSNIPPLLGLPALYPINQQRNIIVRSHSSQHDSIDAFQTNLICRLLATFPSGYLTVNVVDLKQSGSAFNYLNLINQAWANFQPAFTSLGKTKHLFEEIEEHIHKVNYQLASFSSIDEFNINNKGQKIAYRYLVINNFPYRFEPEMVSSLYNIMQNGPRAGVFTIMDWTDDYQVPSRSDWYHETKTKDFWNFSQINNHTIRWDNQPNLIHGDFILDIDEQPPISVVKLISEKSNLGFKAEKQGILAFSNIVIPTDEMHKGNSISSLKVPIGKDEAGDIHYFEIGNDARFLNHGCIIGKSGSGKTNLLRVLITQLLLYYSEDELNLHLITYKQGAGFNNYLDYKPLPVKSLGVQPISRFSLSRLEDTVNIIKLRYQMFSDEAKCDDYQKFRIATGKTLPRILIVIDEFWYLVDHEQEAADHLSFIAREGRGAGVHLLLSTQMDVKSEGSQIDTYNARKGYLSELSFAYSFKIDEISLNPLFKLPEDILNLQRGYAYFSDKQIYSKIRIALLNETEQVTYLAKLKEHEKKENLDIIIHEKQNNKTIIGDIFPKDALQQNLRENPTIHIGKQISINRDLEISLDTDSYSNILLLGPKSDKFYNISINILINCLKSIVSKTVFMNILAPSTNGSKTDTLFLKKIENLSLASFVRVVAPKDLDEFLKEENETLVDPESDSIIINLFLGLDRMMDQFMNKDGKDLLSNLQKLIAQGPAQAHHNVIWSSFQDPLMTILDKNYIRKFRHVIEFKGLANSQILSSKEMASIYFLSDIGVYKDLDPDNESGYLLFRPFILPTREETENYLKRL